MLKTSQVLNVVSAQVKSAQSGQISKSRYFGDGVLRQIQLFQADPFNVLDRGDLVLVQREYPQVCIRHEIFNARDAIIVKEKLA